MRHVVGGEADVPNGILWSVREVLRRKAEHTKEETFIFTSKKRRRWSVGGAKWSINAEDWSGLHQVCTGVYMESVVIRDM